MRIRGHCDTIVRWTTSPKYRSLRRTLSPSRYVSPTTTRTSPKSARLSPRYNHHPIFCRPRYFERRGYGRHRLHQLRQAAPRRSLWRTATFETLRRAFLKVAVRIEELKSRITIALPSAYPYRKALIAMAGCIAAQGP